LSGAIKTAARKLGTVLHEAGPDGMAVSNGRVEPKGNATIITKHASGSAKIDPVWPKN
jgi:phage terminase large subunit-like protein